MDVTDIVVAVAGIVLSGWAGQRGIVWVRDQRERKSNGGKSFRQKLLDSNDETTKAVRETGESIVVAINNHDIDMSRRMRDTNDKIDKVSKDTEVIRDRGQG